MCWWEGTEKHNNLLLSSSRLIEDLVGQYEVILIENEKLYLDVVYCKHVLHWTNTIIT